MPDERTRIDIAYRSFYNAMLQGGVKPLAIAAFDLLGWPIAIVDDISHVICQVPQEEIGIPDWDTLLKEHATPPDHFLDFFGKYLTNPETRSYPLLINDGYSSKSSQIINTFFVNGIPSGNIIVHVMDREVTEEDIEIVRLLGTALSSEIEKFQERENFINKRRLQRFVNILESNSSSPSVHKDLEILSKDFPKDYVLIVSKIKGSSFDSRVLEYACNEIAKSKPKHLLSTSYNENIVTLISNLSKTDTSYSVLNSTIPSVLDTFSKYPLASSITTVFHNLNQISSFYHQALLTLKLGLRNNPEKSLYFFDEYVPLQIFLPATENYPLDTFLHPLLMDIDRYDKRNNTEYFKTLEAYILCGLNSSNASKELSIHKNTLHYRITRIKDLFDIDFSNTKLINILLCNFYLVKSSKQ